MYGANLLALPATGGVRLVYLAIGFSLLLAGLAVRIWRGRG